MVIQALYYDVCDIGKHIKKSKRKFTWRFSIDGKEHTIEFYTSVLSGKRKIIHNGSVLYEGQKVLTTSFQFPFSIDINMLNIVQHGDTYELRINNQVFAHLYNQQKMKQEFKWEYGDGENESEKRDKDRERERERDREDKGQSYESNDYYPKKETKTTSGWGSVNQAKEKMKKNSARNERNDDEDESSNNDPGFSSGFEAFEYKGKKNSETTNRGFDDYKNTYSKNEEKEKRNSASGFENRASVKKGK